MRFVDRTDAGRRLAAGLAPFRGHDLVVCGMPRGGVPVAFQVAWALNAPLDVICVRKLGVPDQPELAMGAVGEGGARFVDDRVVQLVGITAAEFEHVERRETAALADRMERFRSGRAAVELAGRTVIIVDDGIATGSSARVACQVARTQHADRVVLAVPVAPISWTKRLAGAADDYVCLQTPERMVAVGYSYKDFTPTRDQEVIDCLTRVADRPTV